MQTWHEIFQTRVESKVDGFIPIADIDNLVHYIFYNFWTHDYCCIYFWGGFTVYCGNGPRFEPGTNLAACGRGNQVATLCTLWAPPQPKLSHFWYIVKCGCPVPTYGKKAQPWALICWAQPSVLVFTQHCCIEADITNQCLTLREIRPWWRIWLDP